LKQAKRFFTQAFSGSYDFIGHFLDIPYSNVNKYIAVLLTFKLLNGLVPGGWTAANPVTNVTRL